MRSHFKSVCSFLCLAAVTLTAQQTTLAVIDLEGIGVSQSEAVALSNRLRNELFRIGTFRVVERGLMEQILGEQDFQQTGCTSNECLVEMGRILGVAQMVGGTISRVGTMFSVSARLIDVQTGEVLNVSDYDLQGGLEAMLTTGMYEVALVLSRGETGGTVSQPPEVVVASPPEEQESTSDRPEKSGTSPFALSTRPELHAWQSRANVAWRPGTDYGFTHVSLSRALDRSLRLGSRRIRPIVTGSFSSRRSRDADGEETYEYLWYTSLAARGRWALKEEQLQLSLYLGPGVAWRIYDHTEYDPQRGVVPMFVSGAQLAWQIRGSTALVVDGSLLSTPDFGTSAMFSFGLQGPFLSGGLPGVLSLVITAFLFNFSS